jgi:hypothetical protein
MQALLSDPEARSKVRFGYAGAERMVNPLAGHVNPLAGGQPRMQALLSGPKARSKSCFGDANAERM